MHYQGELENGTVVDKSYETHPEGFKFILGSDHVIKGWEEGISTMKLGEKADLYIEPEYGYGHLGCPPKIPSDASLMFTIELLCIHDRRVPKYQMEDKQLIEATLKFKADGNISYKKDRFKEAEGLYRDAISHLNHMKNENDKILELKKNLYSNIAVTLCKT